MDRRLTFSLETGEWGLKGHDIKQVPGRLMGFKKPAMRGVCVCVRCMAGFFSHQVKI